MRPPSPPPPSGSSGSSATTTTIATITTKGSNNTSTTSSSTTTAWQSPSSIPTHAPVRRKRPLELEEEFEQLSVSAAAALSSCMPPAAKRFVSEDDLHMRLANLHLVGTRPTAAAVNILVRVDEESPRSSSGSSPSFGSSPSPGSSPTNRSVLLTLDAGKTPRSRGRPNRSPVSRASGMAAAGAPTPRRNHQLPTPTSPPPPLPLLSQALPSPSVASSSSTSLLSPAALPLFLKQRFANHRRNNPDSSDDEETVDTAGAIASSSSTSSSASSSARRRGRRLSRRGGGARGGNMLFRRVVEFDEHLGYIGDEETGDTEFEEDRYSDDQAQAGSRGPESWSRGEAASPFRTTRSSSTGKKGGSSGNNKSSSPTCKRDRLHMLPVYECHPRILIPATPSPLASTLSFEFATGLPTPRLNPEASQLVLYRPLPVSRLSVGTCEDSGLPTPPPTSVAPSPLALSSLSLQSSPSSLSIGDHIIRSLWNKQRVSVSLGLMQLDDEDRRVRVKIGRTMDVD